MIYSCYQSNSSVC